MRASKRPRTAAANRKPANGKLSLALIKLVQNELLSGFPKAKSSKDSSNKDDNNTKLLSMRVGKKPKTVVANEKPASGKLLLVSTKLALRIRQDVRAKKIFTLKTGYQKTDCA